MSEKLIFGHDSDEVIWLSRVFLIFSLTNKLFNFSINYLIFKKLDLDETVEIMQFILIMKLF